MTDLFVKLPPLIRLESDRIVCGGCRRRWRRPADLNAENYAYLCDHADLHRRDVRHPQVLVFRPYDRRRPKRDPKPA